MLLKRSSGTASLLTGTAAHDSKRRREPVSPLTDHDVNKEISLSCFNRDANSFPSSVSSTFNDPIHGIIHINGLCRHIIDTKEFQRLRNLKQLGTCFFVFPGALHSRFEHSIGVAHCAEVVATNLRDHQPHLGITLTDILCVKVAGLCHDLGHGPFSHLYDGVFMARVKPNRKWRHEDGSVQMLNYLLKQNGIDLNDYGLSALDHCFIEEIIRGTPETERKGRGREKFYLYDIVNNSRSGLDVDKLDYFQRDVKYSEAVAGNTMSFHRFIEFGRVYEADPILNPITRKPSTAHISIPYLQSSCLDCPSAEDYFSDAAATTSASDIDADATAGAGADKHYMICYPEKMVREVVDLFSVRFRLHLNVCTHKSVKKIDYMMTDAMEKADPYIKIPGSVTFSHPDGLYRMSECVEDPCALSNLNDNVLYLIENSRGEELRPAREILERIHSRKFYSCMGKFIYYQGERPHLLTITQITAALVAISQDIVARRRATADRQTNTTTVNTRSAGVNAAAATTATADAAGAQRNGGLVLDIWTHSSDNDNNDDNKDGDDNGNDVDDSDGGLSIQSQDSAIISPVAGSAAAALYQRYRNCCERYSSAKPNHYQVSNSNPCYASANSYIQSTDSCDLIAEESGLQPPHALAQDVDTRLDTAATVTQTTAPDSTSGTPAATTTTTTTTTAAAITTTAAAVSSSWLEPLSAEDIIVEKVNIHHGMKEFNPVANIRFFPKNAPPTYHARAADERTYETSLPRCFQELAVRVFCRFPEKDKLACEAFEVFCRGCREQAQHPNRAHR